jgi:curli biogenesis system outer membrane secretion channel CsgG
MVHQGCQSIEVWQEGRRPSHVSVAALLFFTALAHGLEPAPEAKAVPQGVVLRVAGICTIKSDGAKDVTAQKDSPVRIGDRVSCKPGASIRLRLPGSGEEREFKSDKTLAEYLVPAAQSAAPLDSTNRGGRDAKIESFKDAAPAPRLAGVEAMGALPPANAGSARGIEEVLAEAERQRIVTAILSATDIRKCEVPVGTLAIVEASERSSPESLQHAGLQLTTPTLQAAARSSNCFVVVPNGSVAMNKMLAERALAGAAAASAGPRASIGASDYVLVSRSVDESNRRISPGLWGFGAGSNSPPLKTELRLVDARTGAAIGSSQVKVAERRVPIAGGQGARASAVTAEEQARVVSETAKSFNAFVDAVRVSKGVGAQPAAAAAAAAMPAPPASGPR